MTVTSDIYNMHIVHTVLLLLYSPNHDQDQYVEAAIIRGMILGLYNDEVVLRSRFS